MQEIVISEDHEHIAQAMLSTRGDIAKASRSSSIPYNAMSLRTIVRDNPCIRLRYHELLALEMQEKGLHIAERILKMAELQDRAMNGGTMSVMGMDGSMEEVETPPDPAMVIKLSQEISRLISEGKGQRLSAVEAEKLSAKLDGRELLEGFLS